MEFVSAGSFKVGSEELEKYIKQIKSYETMAEIIEATAQEEAKLKDGRPDWILVLFTGIAGIQFHVDMKSNEGKRILRSLTPGTELKMKREPKNKHDRWAIAVYTQKDEMLGYVTRFKNEAISRLMDSGYKFHAIIENELAVNRVAEENRAFTENYRLPYSIWMER